MHAEVSASATRRTCRTLAAVTRPLLAAKRRTHPTPEPQELVGRPHSCQPAAPGLG